MDRRATSQLANEYPFLSVVVPVRNEERGIERVLRDLLAQTYPRPRYEILVVDGESTDATPEIVSEIARDHPRVRLLKNPRRLSSAARNIGVREARGELIVIVDGHCECPTEAYLAEVADAFRGSGADCLGRPQPLDVADATRLQRAIAAARSSRLGHHPSSWIYARGEAWAPAASVAVAYRRSVFTRVGGFDESFDACEDFEFNHRVDREGLRCWFSDRIAMPYAPRRSLAQLFRQLWRYGRGRVRLMRKHPDTAGVATWVPAAFVAGLVVGAFLAAFGHPLRGLAFAGIALYAGLVAGFSLHAAWRARDGALFPWLPPVFLTIHVACGTSQLWELVAGHRPENRGPAAAGVAEAVPPE